MGRYIRDLVAQLSQMHHGNRNIHLSIDAEDIYLSVTQAIPCALVVNEIVSNAYKHAFDDKENGNISILLETIKEQRIHLNIKDNGVGIPDNIDIDKTETLGMKLVRDLVSRQLKGDLQINIKDGTKIDIQFQLIKE